jgi:hypothetical protein
LFTEVLDLSLLPRVYAVRPDISPGGRHLTDERLGL